MVSKSCSSPSHNGVRDPVEPDEEAVDDTVREDWREPRSTGGRVTKEDIGRDSVRSREESFSLWYDWAGGVLSLAESVSSSSSFSVGNTVSSSVYGKNEILKL